jgi:hypothetical protein
MFKSGYIGRIYNYLQHCASLHVYLLENKAGDSYRLHLRLKNFYFEKKDDSNKIL